MLVLAGSYSSKVELKASHSIELLLFLPCLLAFLDGLSCRNLSLFSAAGMAASVAVLPIASAKLLLFEPLVKCP